MVVAWLEVDSGGQEMPRGGWPWRERWGNDAKGGRGKKEARLSKREVRGTHRGGGWRRGGTEVVRRREPTAVKGHHATVTLREGRAEVSYGGRNGRVWR